MFADPAVAKSPWSAKYGPFENCTPRHQLGDQEVEIRVALAVRVRRHVDRHAGDRRREVGAVIEVEAAQEVLVGLALAAVLLMMTPGTVSSTSPARMIGRASSCRAVIAPWLADCAMPTRFSAGFSTSARLANVRLPVTVTSALSDRCRTTSTRTAAATTTSTSRRELAKLIRREDELIAARRNAIEAIVAPTIA